MKKIILINSLNTGGAERQISIISKFIADKIYLWEDKIDYRVEQDIEFIDKNAKNNISGFKVFFYIFKIALLLSKKLKKQDLIISFLEKNNFINIISACISKHKCIVCERTQPSVSFKGFSGSVNKILINLLYPRSDLIIANSNGVKSDLIYNFNINRNKIKVIYNGFDFDYINKKKYENIDSFYESLIENKELIVSVGRLTEAKGHWHLIRAMKDVVDINKNTILFIIGDGNLKEYLQSLIIKLELDKNVYLLGKQENPFKFIARSKLFVFPSLWEGFPNAIVEAMYCNVPIIASNCKSGPCEILNDVEYKQIFEINYAKFGILIPTSDGKKYTNEDLTNEEKIMAKAIIETLRDQKLCLHYQKVGLLRSMDFSLEKIVPQWNDVINININCLK